MNSTRNHPQKAINWKGWWKEEKKGEKKVYEPVGFEIARNLKTMGVATEMIIQATKLTTEEFEHL